MMKKTNNTLYFIISEIILLGILTPFLAKPIFMLGVKLFAIFIGLEVNKIVGYFLVCYVTPACQPVFKPARIQRPCLCMPVNAYAGKRFAVWIVK